MSSPFAGANYGYPDRATASSPGLGPRGGEPSQGPEDVSVRPMRRERLSHGIGILRTLKLTMSSQGALYL